MSRPSGSAARWVEPEELSPEERAFYVEPTYDTEPLTSDLEMTAERFFAREKEPGVRVEDDLGTEYFESGSGGGGVRVFHASRGFAPAPPPDARVLRITAGGAAVELDLQP